MVLRVSNNECRHREDLIGRAANPEDGRFPARLDAWKLIVCDVRLLEDDASLQDAYDAQIQEEKLQTLAERAREIVRTEDEKMARRNARWFIPAIERLSPEELAQMDLGYNNATKTIWKQVSPAPPAWIQQIVDAKQPWGFVFYKTREVEQSYGNQWAAAWSSIGEQMSLPHSDWDERSAGYACLRNIHCQGNRSVVMHHWTEDWPSGPAAGDVAADKAVRE
jgi:hypothetical protein